MSSLKSLIVLLFILGLGFCIVDRTYYIYLGLPITASQSQIEAAYQTKKIKIQAIEDEATRQKKSVLLQQAYKTLRDQNSRTLYQKFGKELSNKAKLMEMAKKITKENHRKDKAIKIILPVSVEDVYKGATVTAQYFKKVACPHCKGVGAQSPKFLKQCTACAGNGFNVVDNFNMYGQKVTAEATCQSCGGSGKKVTKICPNCGGHKVLDSIQTVQIKIPQGLPDGNVLTIRNFGDEPINGAPSDLQVTINEIPTEDWARDGDNLIYKMKISLKESIFGFSKQFQSLSGEIIPIQREGVTNKQTKVVLKGLGIQNSKTKRKGNLIVNFKIIMPQFTDRQLDMWEEFFESNKI